MRELFPTYYNGIIVTNLGFFLLQGMDRTKRGKFEGGDTAWEEKTQPR